MRARIALVLTAITTSTTFAVEPPLQYPDAEAAWRMTKDDARYQAYVAEFIEFNNRFHLDEKGGCYLLGPEPVNLMLVITLPTKAKLAVVERVLSDVDSAKAKCFKKSYEGVRTKIPPFVPFVLQMGMG